MLIKWLGLNLGTEAGMWIGAFTGLIISFFLMWKPLPFLLHDGGKRVETPDGKIVVVNENSNGKVTGIGVLFVPVFLLMAFLFLPVNLELAIYIGLMFLMMLTGFLDDAATTPWGELVKGLLDLLISLGAVITFLAYHSPNVTFFGNTFHMPVVIYGALGVILMWSSINVTNCADGVDGLCGSVSIVEFAAFYLIFRTVMPVYAGLGILLSGCLLAYLCFNWNPSKVLMGDAGSRTIGFLIALLSMQSGHPFLFLILSLVFLLDGGLGLLKMTIIRVFKVNPMKNLLTPIHDHLRKRKGVPIKAIPLIYAGLQIILSVIAWLIIWLQEK